MALVKDVVCGMQIESAAAAATSDYNGTTYYFCAVGCKTTFDANPEKYLSVAAPSTAGKRWWEFWKS
jgi:Cu+-exporting ATPase